MESELPDWAMAAAKEVTGEWLIYDHMVARLARALVAAERRGIERAAEVADEIAAGRSRQKMEATSAKKRTEARDFESMAMSAIDVSYAIRQIGVEG